MSLSGCIPVTSENWSAWEVFGYFLRFLPYPCSHTWTGMSFEGKSWEEKYSWLILKRHVERKTVIIVRIVAIYQSLALLNSHLAPELNLTQLSRGSKKKRQITWPYLPILQTLGPVNVQSIPMLLFTGQEKRRGVQGGVPLGIPASP